MIMLLTWCRLFHVAREQDGAKWGNSVMKSQQIGAADPELFFAGRRYYMRRGLLC